MLRRSKNKDLGHRKGLSTRTAFWSCIHNSSRRQLSALDTLTCLLEVLGRGPTTSNGHKSVKDQDIEKHKSFLIGARPVSFPTALPVLGQVQLLETKCPLATHWLLYSIATSFRPRKMGQDLVNTDTWMLQSGPP